VIASPCRLDPLLHPDKAHSAPFAALGPGKTGAEGANSAAAKSPWVIFAGEQNAKLRQHLTGCVPWDALDECLTMVAQKQSVYRCAYPPQVGTSYCFSLSILRLDCQERLRILVGPHWSTGPRCMPQLPRPMTVTLGGGYVYNARHVIHFTGSSIFSMRASDEVGMIMYSALAAGCASAATFSL
jgi:hypothetical protein